MLLANAYNKLPNTDIYSVSVADLSRKLGYASNDTEHLKETLEALVDCTVEWNILGKDNKQEWGVASLLASALSVIWAGLKLFFKDCCVFYLAVLLVIGIMLFWQLTAKGKGV